MEALGIMKLLLFAAALVTIVSAQCSILGTSTINRAAQASSLSSCETFSGSIAIATGTTGEIALDGISEIEGSLVAINVTQLTSLSGDALTSVTGDFTLENLTILSTLDFSQLTTIGNLTFQAIPALQTFSFASDLSTTATADNVVIQDCQLESLDGINLRVVQQNLFVANNHYMTSIDMQLESVGGQLLFEGNGNGLSVDLANLQSALNITFRNISSASLGSLQTINGTLFVEGGELSSFTANSLTTVGQSLSLTSNSNLSDISFSSLTEVFGGVVFDNNTKLKDMDGFPSLTSIGGAIDLQGPFTSVSFPAITSVAGDLIVNSTADLSCDTFDAIASAGGIGGDYSCQTANDTADSTAGNATNTATGTGGVSSPTGQGSGGDNSTSSSNNKDGLSTGAEAGVGIGVAVGVIGTLALMWLYRWYRKRRTATKVAKAAEMNEEKSAGIHEEPLQELAAGDMRQELSPRERMAEVGGVGREVRLGEEEQYERHELPENQTPVEMLGDLPKTPPPEK